MNVDSIFGPRDTNRVRVPQIEVQGDRLRVQQDQPAEVVEESVPDPENRTIRLPKTKWF